MTNTAKPYLGYRACVARHLENKCKEIKAEFRSNSELAEFERTLRKLNNACVKAGADSRSSLVRVPDQTWFDRCDELFESCLGSLEVFRPAASHLREFERLTALTSKLGHVLNFAHSLQYGL